MWLSVLIVFAFWYIWPDKGEQIMERVLAYNGLRNSGAMLLILGIAMVPAVAQNAKRELPQRVHAEPPGGASPRAADGSSAVGSG